MKTTYEPIDYLLNSLINLAGGMGDLAQNPALPEMVRSRFSDMSTQLHMCHSTTRDVANNLILAGTSSRCQGLRDAQRWFDMTSLPYVDLTQLAVKTKWDWHETPVEEQTDEYWSRYWSQFFYTEYSAERFTGEESKLVTEFTRDGIEYSVTVKGKLTTPSDDPNPKMVIDYVHVAYKPTTVFWLGHVTISNHAVTFNKNPKLELRVSHLVEGDDAHADIHTPIPLIVDYVINPLKDLLGFEWVDYQMSAGHGVVHDVEATIKSIASTYPEHRVSRAIDAMVYACNQYGSNDGLVIDVENICQVNLVTGDRNWRSYAQCEETRKKDHWSRSTPLAKIQFITRHGRNLTSTHLPQLWVDAIDNAIVTGLKAVCEKVTNWPLSPEEQAAVDQAKYDEQQAKPID